MDQPNDIAGGVALHNDDCFGGQDSHHGDDDDDMIDHSNHTGQQNSNNDSFTLDEEDTSKALRILSSQRSGWRVCWLSVASRLNVFTFYAFGVVNATLSLIASVSYSCDEGMSINNNGDCVKQSTGIYESQHQLNVALAGLVIIPIISQILTLYATCGVYVYAARTAETRTQQRQHHNVGVCSSWLQATCLLGDPANVFCATSVFAAIRNNGDIKFTRHPGAIILTLALCEDAFAFYYCSYFMQLHTSFFLVLKLAVAVWHFTSSMKLMYFLFLKYSRFTLHIPHLISDGFFYRVIMSFDWDATVDFFEILAEKEWMINQEMSNAQV